MSHAEQLGFLRLVADANVDLLANARVLEIGAYDVNGSMRDIFSGAESYMGVDLVEGPGVDLVSHGHSLTFPDATFDVVLSGECFEHDPHWRETFLRMSALTRPGGVVAFTCASRGRPEHGTRRTRSADSPGTQARGLDYYRNLTEADFTSAFPLGDYFSAWCFHYLRSSFDLYFAAIRRGQDGTNKTGSLPNPGQVARLAHLMPLRHRLARLPLRLSLHLASDEQAYQNFAARYWTSMQRVQRTISRT